MDIKLSHTSHSTIVAMGSRLAEATKKTGKEYIMLNRGVNSVVNININPIAQQIDFNSNDIQVYPGTKGKKPLRNAINNEYFGNGAAPENILITGGGISGLDICFQNIETNEVILPPLFWGTYAQLLNLRGMPYKSYPGYDYLKNNAPELTGKAVVICDPGNPLGEKYPDEKLIELITLLNKNGVMVIFDSPYRRLFFNKTDNFYQQIMHLQNVIIVESFSKSLGLSGQRIGFIYAANSNFITEAALRIMYATNGINGFAQVLVTRLLTTEPGIKSVTAFKEKTVCDIKANIKFLESTGLLANEFYKDTTPMGIFSVINKSPEKLFNNRIGSVGLSYFTKSPFEGIGNYSRILVSYPHQKFVSFLQTLI